MILIRAEATLMSWSIFLPCERRNLFKLLEMQRELGYLFSRNVDLTTPASLSKYFRDDVLDHAGAV